MLDSNVGHSTPAAEQGELEGQAGKPLLLLSFSLHWHWPASPGMFVGSTKKPSAVSVIQFSSCSGV